MPDLIQPVVGYRVWLASDESLVSAGFGDMEWQPGTNEASCDGYDRSADLFLSRKPRLGVDPHPAPDPGCGCGFYAYHDVPPHDGRTIAGAVAAWGRIQVHHRGFRAEKAQIIALAIPDAAANDPELREQVLQLAARYRCKAVPACDLRTAAREHGIEMPEELRPAKPKPLPSIEIQFTIPPIQFATGGTLKAFGAPATPKPKPGKRWPGLGATLAAYVANASTLIWLLFLVGLSEWTYWVRSVAIVAAALTAMALAPLTYRLALRLRCEWRWLLVSDRGYHHAGVIPTHNRFRMNLSLGDRCPECGWRLK